MLTAHRPAPLKPHTIPPVSDSLAPISCPEPPDALSSDLRDSQSPSSLDCSSTHSAPKSETVTLPSPLHVISVISLV